MSEPGPDDFDMELGDLPPFEPYVFSIDQIPALAALIDDACRPAGRLLHEISQLCSETMEAAETFSASLIREVANSFLYRLKVDRKEGTAGASLEPLAAPKAGQYAFPTPVAAVDGEIVKLWVSLLEYLTVPLARAWFSDLLYERKNRPIGERLQMALDNYLTCSSEAHHGLLTSLCAVRAWTLARKSNAGAPAEEATRSAAWQIVSAQLGPESTPVPGVVLPLLSALCTPMKSTKGFPETEPSIDDALQAVLDAYDDEHIVDRVVKLQMKRAGDGDRDTLSRSRVDARLKHADQSEGHLKMFHLDQAARLASQLGLSDLADLAVSKMQEIPPESLEWITFSTPFQLPYYTIEQYVSNFDRQPDWRFGLAHWFSTDPPSGTYPENRRRTEESLEGMIAHKIFGTRVFGAHHLPERSIATDDEAVLEQEIHRTELLNCEVYGALLAFALDRIGEISEPERSSEAVASFMVDHFGCDSELATRFADALLLYWERNFTAAAHLSLPLVEAAARNLLLELNEPLYRVEQGKKIGQYPGLGTLLPLLENEGLDKDWVRYIRVLLLPDGKNLRNLIAHGFTHRLGPVDAALILRAVCSAYAAHGTREECRRHQRGHRSGCTALAEDFTGSPGAPGCKSRFERVQDDRTVYSARWLT